MRPDVYDIPTNTWSTRDAADAPPANLSETYDSTNDVLIVHSGLQVFAYHPDEDTWEVRDPLDPIMAPNDSGAGPYGRFFFDPVDSVVVFIDGKPSVWAYRY